MVRSKKAKVKVLALVLVVSLAALVMLFPNQRVEVLYFTSPSCIVASGYDMDIEKIKHEFGDKINLKTIIIDLDNRENDPKYVRELREKYDVIKVPTVIINGEESKPGEAKINICRNFIIKPGACY